MTPSNSLRRRDPALVKFPIDNDFDRAHAQRFEKDLGDTTDHVPGWMVNASGIGKVIDLIDDAIMAYDEEQSLHGPGDDTNGMDPRYLAAKNPDETHVRDIDTN
jgi:hypothetical protein